MDSLHPSLSQALPPRGYDAEQVLQAPFRAAALGIATFYKKAAENGRKAYSLGYSSALQDVLEYLQAGLDHGTDNSSKPQRSEQRMALTIERVMDYIERRQEALRAESLEFGDDENNNPISATVQNQQSSTSLPSTNNAQSRPAESRPQPQIQHLSNSSVPRESTAHTTSTTTTTNNTQASSTSHRSVTSSDSPTPPQTHTTLARRTSPRRATPVNPEPARLSPVDQHQSKPQTEQTSDSSSHEAETPQSTTPNLNVLNPINLDFSSLMAAPLSQLQIPTPTNVTAHPSRRYRGTHPTEGRKGKAKERGCSSIDRERSSGIAAGSVPFETISPLGYSHYASGHFPSGSSESGGATRVLSSIGNKRRYPTIDPTVVIHESNSSPVHRTIRKSNHRSFNPIEEVVTERNHHHHHHHQNDDDVMMVLGDEPSLERPSKRTSRRHGTGGGGGGGNGVGGGDGGGH